MPTSKEFRDAKKAKKRENAELLTKAKRLYRGRGMTPYAARRRPHSFLVDVYFHLDKNGKGTGPLNLECVTHHIKTLLGED